MNQKWIFAFKNGFYTIQNASSKLYLTASTTAGKGGSKLVQEPLQTSDAELWSVTGSGGSWVLHNKGTGLVIADPSGSLVRGLDIVVAAQDGTASEQWGVQ